MGMTMQKIKELAAKHQGELVMLIDTPWVYFHGADGVERGEKFRDALAADGYPVKTARTPWREDQQGKFAYAVRCD